MAETVFLHIGLPKTGTTFIQSTLWRGHAADEEIGVDLPGRSRRDHLDAATDLCRGSAGPRGAWAELADEVAETSGVAVISEEKLTSASADAAAHAVRSLQPADVHVVLTLRDLGRQLPSVWQQTIKQRGMHTLAGYVGYALKHDDADMWKRQDPVRVLSRWAPHVPQQNLHLITVPPPGIPKKVLWERFAALVGCDPTLVEKVTSEANPSLGAVEIELLRRFNEALDGRLPSGEPYRAKVRRGLVRRLERQTTDAARTMVPEHLWPDVESKAAQMIDDLRMVRCDLKGDLDELRPTRVGGSPVVEEADIAAAAIEALILTIRRS